MRRLRHQPESHFVNRIGWLRAAVLGANDGIIFTEHLFSSSGPIPKFA
jgi:VIT1/CCC1 family predicted Fe2+/Mn2+ transporter